MKTITICEKEYKIECNAFMYIQHKRIFGKGLMQDMQILKDYLVTQTITALKLKEANPKISELELAEKLSETMMSKIDDFIEAITRIAYTMIYEANENVEDANENVEDYETFLKGISKFKIDDNWIVEVAEYAVNCFC